MNQARAILIRKNRLTETSLAVTWLTSEVGKIRTVVRGAMRPGGNFSGKIDLFYEATIYYEAPKRGDLHVLKDMELVAHFAPAKAAYATTLLAAYFAELVDVAVEPQHAVPEIYELLARALRYLQQNPPTERVLTHFEQRLAETLGLGGGDRNVLQQHLERLPSGRPHLVQTLLHLGG